MRVLHLITAAATAEASFGLARSQADAGGGETELVVMAPEDSAVIAWSMACGIAALRLRPGQTARRLRDAVVALQPDVIHLHGALASDRAMPLSVFAHLPSVLQLAGDDFDVSGMLQHQVRGIRLDRARGEGAWVVCTRPTPNGAPVLSSQLPIGVANVAIPEHSRATPDWFLAVYRRLLAASPVRVPSVVASAMG